MLQVRPTVGAKNSNGCTQATRNESISQQAQGNYLSNCENLELRQWAVRTSYQRLFSTVILSGSTFLAICLSVSVCFHQYTPIYICLLRYLPSLDAHNHVDDYSGTLGGVRKSTFQFWSQVLKIELLHCHSLSLSLKNKTKQNKTKKHLKN